MKLGVVNKSTILNRYVLHTLQRNITHLAVITCKTNIKFDILKGRTGKEPRKLQKRQLDQKIIPKTLKSFVDFVRILYDKHFSIHFIY